MTDKNDLLSIDDTCVTKVDLSGLRGWQGRELYVKLMSFSELLAYGATLAKEEAAKNDVYVRLLYSICDADGNLLLDESDLPWLRKRNFLFINRLVDVLNKLEADEQEENFVS